MWLHFVKCFIISYSAWNPGICQLTSAPRLHQITSQSTWIFGIFEYGMSPAPPPPPSMSRLGLSLCALTRPYCNLSPPPSICSAKTYKQEMHRNAPVSAVPLCAALFCYWYFISWGFIFAISTGQYEKKALNSRFKHFQLFRLSMETGPLQRY